MLVISASIVIGFILLLLNHMIIFSTLIVSLCFLFQLPKVLRHRAYPPSGGDLHGSEVRDDRCGACLPVLSQPGEAYSRSLALLESSVSGKSLFFKGCRILLLVSFKVLN